MINWIARFGWSVALIVGVYAALRPQNCRIVLADRPLSTDVSPPPRSAYRYQEGHGSRGFPPRSNPTWLSGASMTITLDPYKSDRAIATWVWTTPEGRTIIAGRNIVIRPPEARR